MEVHPVGEELHIECTDGIRLAGTLYAADESKSSAEGPLVLISGATGAPRGFYGSFARALANAGARAVLTYDYRGMSASPRPSGWSGRINMRDWARLDMAAAIERLHAVAPDRKMVGIGHSFGGQALGICGRPERFDRYCLIASLSGYWRGTDTPWKNLIMMNVIGVPLTTLFGRTIPAMGLGDSIPASVFRDWTRWYNNPEYFFDDPQVGARAGYAAGDRRASEAQFRR
jgi:predicted alpha/beta hydrolase